MKTRKQEMSLIRTIVSSSVITLLSVFLVSSGAESKATRLEMQAEIDNLVSISDREVSQDIEVINAINVALAKPLSLTVGVVSGRNGMTVDVPVYLKSGPSAISSIGFDISVPSGLTITSVVAGIAAQAAGKNIQGNAIPGAFRVIVFGLNQTVISSGPVAILRVSSAPSSSGKKVISINNLSASDPGGNGVTLTGNNGSLTVN